MPDTLMTKSELLLADSSIDRVSALQYQRKMVSFVTG
jgi:hypothetical protein